MLLTGVAGLTSFGQAAFVGLGAYTTAVADHTYGVSPWLTVCDRPRASPRCAGAGARLDHAADAGHYLPLATIAWGISLYYLFGNLDFARQVPA